jgi:hypothetical protein
LRKTSKRDAGIEALSGEPRSDLSDSPDGRANHRPPLVVSSFDHFDITTLNDY